MNSVPFLKKQIDLLLDSFGEDAVLDALFERKGLNVQTEQRQRSRARRSPEPRRRIATASEIIERVARKHPDRLDEIRNVGFNFESRSFLPNTRDINRFLSKYGERDTKVESRLKALPKVLSIVAGMEKNEIMRLLETVPHTNSSSFSLISDAIMSRD